MSRRKTSIPEMMPQKKWLSKKEAMAYMDLGLTEFEALVKEGHLSMSRPTGGTKTYFSVEEINRFFAKKTFYKATA